MTDLQIKWPDVASPKTSRHVALHYITGWWFHFFLFSIIYGIILPIDFHIFQDGYCTANQIAYVYSWGYCVYFTEIITLGLRTTYCARFVWNHRISTVWLGYPINAIIFHNIPLVYPIGSLDDSYMIDIIKYHGISWNVMKYLYHGI